MSTDGQDGQAPKRSAPATRVVFYGLGLIGGSCAAATQRAWPGVERVAVDRAVILDVAIEQGLVDLGFVEDELEQALEGADLVVISLPVLAITDVLDRHGSLLKDK